MRWTRSSFFFLLAWLLVAGLSLVPLSPVSAADAPPYWEGGHGPAVLYPPVMWPADNAWVAYTSQGAPIKDPRTQDPSNGGTSPQNYVNVSSGCPDQSLPSVYYQYDAGTQMVFFRWRVEKIANTYGTGPNAGAYGSTDTWNSAQWTVMIDTDGDGYREFAVHLDGSSGSPSAPVDRIVSIYSDTNSQSLDYVTDPTHIHQLTHNSTAFVDQPSSKILNFQNSLNPATTWPNGSSETVWDYGTTRSTNISTAGCTEFYVDYQIPLAMLDAAAVGGPTITGDTPISFLFVTANSLNDPLQKDAVLNGDFIGDPNLVAPYGDLITLNGGLIQQPLVKTVTAAGCGPTTLSAQVNDALVINAGSVATSVTQVDFYYYPDSNANGLADDGQTWTLAASGATTNSPLGRWSASWNSAGLPRGQYLLGVQALDNATLNASGKANRTFSYLSAGQVAALTPPAGELYYANASPIPGVQIATFVNGCGVPPPYVTKSVSPSQTTVGSPVQFTVTVHNTSAGPLAVSQVNDNLPPGFTYVSTSGSGTLGTAATTPTPGASGTVQWTFSPAANVPAGSSRTLIFTANAAAVVGTYANVAAAVTGGGTLTSDPVEVGVGAPRLTIAKSASVTSANPGDSIIYTIRYSNDSPVNVSNAAISDVLPLGLGFVSASAGGSYNAGSRTITWNVGNLPAGDGPYTVSFTATVDSPYPLAAAIPLVNTATITSNETTPANASASTFVNAPRPALRIQKDANLTQVAAGSNVVFTINYANTGNATATGVTISDPLPAGFTYQSASPTPSSAPAVGSGGTVNWTIGSLAAGASGSLNLTLKADNPYAATNPATNTATISATGVTPAADSFQVGVTQAACTNGTTYYFRSATANVGFDGTQRIANTTAPTAPTAATASQTTTGGVPIEVARFYQDPVMATAASFAGTISVDFYVDSGPGQNDFVVSLYDYDPASGSRTLLGSTPTVTSPGNKTNNPLSGALTPSGIVAQNHRLLWIFTVTTNQNSNSTLNFDGTASPSRSTVCPTALNLIVDKQVSALSIQPGGALAYTIKFANTGNAAVSGARIVDTLPTGVTYGSATLNGVAATPAVVAGQQVTFDVNSSGQAAGVVAAGAAGTLVINATTNLPLAAGITTLPNSASLSSNQTAAVNDAATTAVLRPNVTIAKAATPTLLTPGATVTYTLTVVNNGLAGATNVTVNDVLPGAAYFAYVAGSAKLNGTPITPDPVSAGVLNHNLGTLAAGASATISLRMQVATSGVPAGITTRDNAATVSDAQTPGTRPSETVTVAISTNPNLRLSKSRLPAGTLAPGDLVTYTLTLQNTGNAAASAVLVNDPLPANATYAAGTLRYQGVAQTDVLDADNGRLDAVNSRIVFDVGTLAAGDSKTMAFSVRVDKPLPAGTTPVNNSATASAANTATKTATANASASAGPTLTLDKTGPASIAYPAANLSADVAAAVVLPVNDTSQLAVGQHVLIAGQTRQIVAVNSGSITVDSALTASNGAQVIGSLTYSLNYANSGNAAATSVTLQDTLPAGAVFITASGGGSHAAGVVTWNLGTLAAGSGGSRQVTVFAGSAGTAINTATLTSAETAPVNDAVSTGVGGLRVRKLTTTPVVIQTLSGATAAYQLAIDNTAGTAATGVRITDTLPAGFSYATPSTFGGNATRSATLDPLGGATQPAWGTWTIPAGGSLTIAFNANIAASVGAAVYQNELHVTSDNVAVVPFDPLATTEEDVQVKVPAVKLSKSVSPTTTVAGRTVTYTITIDNKGDADATGVQVTDNLPAGFTYDSEVSIQETGATRTATVTPSAGSQTPTWGTWTIPPAARVVIAFKAVTSATAGTYYNNLSASATNAPVPPLVNQAPVTTQPPLGILLAEFTATAQGPSVLVAWETTSEIGNLGFNLYRGLSASGPTTRLNPSLIPSQSPGSSQGFAYTWLDHDVTPGETYYYWLDDVDVQGRATRHGPASATAATPTAVGLQTLQARNWPSGIAGLLGSVVSCLVVAWLYGRRRASKG